MATVASSRGPTETINARRTESVDAPAILELVGSRTRRQFGLVNIVHLIEKANLSVTLSNEENEVLGFSGFLDHPQVEHEICDPADWESWTRDMDDPITSKCTPMNSLFMHYFAAKEDYTIGCASEIIRTVFNAVPQLHFVLLLVKAEVELEPALAEVFEQTFTYQSPSGCHYVMYACQRHKHVPVLHIRKAVVEDHDDLTPLFNRLDSQLTKTYGQYFLAETIEAQDEHNHALVAEVNGKAIGFMSICSSVNTAFLQDNYELEVFHGLHEPHADDVLTEDDVIETPVAQAESRREVVAEAENSDSAESENVTSDSDDSDASKGEKVESAASTHGATDAAGAAPEHGSLSPKLSDAHMRTGTQLLPAIDTVDASTSSTSDDDEKFDNVALNVSDDVPMTSPPSFKPTYVGEASAFSIQLFCINEQYEMRSSDFLPHVFKLFPGKSFAVCTVPHLVPEFPLLQQFVRVTPRLQTNTPHELYVFHRHGLIASSFRVRKATAADYPQVESLVTKIALKENLLEDLRKFNEARRDDDGTEIQAFVADCLGQVVGVCVIRREEAIEYVRSHYNIEDFIYFNHHRRDEHAHIHHLVLNPIFQHNSKHFLKEILRQGHKSCLYYPIYPSYDGQVGTSKHSLITCLDYLVPVRARRQIVYPIDELGVNAPSTRVRAELPPFALNHINRKLTLEPKVVVNARVVVVGASDVGVSFLENLCFCPHLRFNNLTLVSKRGLPPVMRSNARTWSVDELARMSLRSWVNQVQGVMVAIDRPHKYVVLRDGTKVAYDYLVLATGQQYHIPEPTRADVDNQASNHDLPKGAVYRPLEGECPENVIAVNDEADHRLLCTWATNMAAKLKRDNVPIDEQLLQPAVVVYGRNFSAYTTVQQLLACGMPGWAVVLARPPPLSTPISASSDGNKGDPFNEPAVLAAVMRALERHQVRVLDDHVLAEFITLPPSTDGGARNVTAVSFTTPAKPRTSLPCSAFVSLYPRRVGSDTFRACNSSFLVVDGRLTVDASFRTNDPLIRAAGPVTKYARRYHADGLAFRHENQSSREIGFRLAMSVLPIFDPTLDTAEDDRPITTAPPSVGGGSRKETLSSMENPNSKLVPTFSEPKVTMGELPGGYTYLHVRKPGERASYVAELDRSEHGTEIVTGSAERGDYFRLHVNQYRTVETVTCLVRGGGHVMSNLVRLYGVHERYLNNLLQRVSEGLIVDLFEFFRQPWAMVLFHDRFHDFRQEIRDLLTLPPEGARELSSMEQTVQQLVDEDLNIDDGQRQALERHFSEVGHRKQVEARLLSFLSYNYYHLPMYSKPGMI